MEPMGGPSQYFPELLERAVRMIFDHAREHPSPMGNDSFVGETLSIATEALRR
jgi:hypothetical protein